MIHFIVMRFTVATWNQTRTVSEVCPCLPRAFSRRLEVILVSAEPGIVSPAHVVAVTITLVSKMSLILSLPPHPFFS